MCGLRVSISLRTYEGRLVRMKPLLVLSLVAGIFAALGFGMLAWALIDFVRYLRSSFLKLSVV